MLVNVEFDFSHERKTRRRSKTGGTARRKRRPKMVVGTSIMTCRLVEIDPHSDDMTSFERTGRTLDELIAAASNVADPSKDIAENRASIRDFLSDYAIAAGMVLRHAIPEATPGAMEQTALTAAA